MSAYLIFTDGGARGNPGPSASAFVVTSPSGQILHTQGAFSGISTNNQAEYAAINLACTWLLLPASRSHLNVVTFYLDSQLVVNQLLGRYRVKEPALISLFTQVSQKISQLKSLGISVNLIHVPRTRNFLADAEVNRILDLHSHN